MRNDYTEQITSDISAPSFHINARYAYQWAGNDRYISKIVCLILLFSRSLSIPVLELQIDKCILFIYFYVISEVSYLVSERTSK